MEYSGLKSRAVVLLSGGLDSATALYIALEQNFEVHALSFRYGQLHKAELEAAARTAEKAGTSEHMVIELDTRLFKGSSLTGKGEVPLDGSPLSGGIPSTYVPARNTVFLSMALAYGESIGAADIFTGVNSIDYSGYPDCRPEYISAFQRMASLATRQAVEGNPTFIRAPLILMTKAEIIRKGLELGVDYSITRSCYRPDGEGRACGRCDACRLRIKGFRENGMEDPAPYQNGKPR